MSETQISKPVQATIKISSLDSHKIVSPAPRAPRQNAPGAPMARPHGGQPISSTPDNVTISRPARIAHVTSSSSSQKSEIKTAPPMPPALAKKLEANKKLLASQRSVSDHLPDYDPNAKPKAAAKKFDGPTLEQWVEAGYDAKKYPGQAAFTRSK